MCSNRKIRRLRAVTLYRPPFRARAVSDTAVHVLDANGLIAAIAFPNEAVLADGGPVQLGEAVADALNNLFPAGAGRPPAASDARQGGRGKGAAGGSSTHGRARP